MKSKRPLLLSPVRSNAGIRAAYRRKLLALVEEMNDSYRYWLAAAYRKHEPIMAQASDSVRASWVRWYKPEPHYPLFSCDPADFSDPLLALDVRPLPPGRWITMDASPAKELQTALNRLARRWKKQFSEAADGLAAYFAKSVAQRSDRQLQSILRKGGWTVKFKMTAAMRDVVAGTVQENVSLIRSIPEELHRQVEGMVMRSVTAGRDLYTVRKELEERLRVPRRRAELIARDQNNKATAMLTNARYREIGIKEAVWLHSAGGKKPRPTHVKNSGKKYNLETGWFDPAVQEFIHPGQLINCRCVMRAVVKGFT